ncbi:MAG: DUF418 domain-containing protein [bacterium]|nr:DUF418 domain-containing protein [bacterium]
METLPEAVQPPAPAPLRPVTSGDRVELLDVLRGFAIFGILLVNMRMFFAPLYLDLSGTHWWPGPIDRAVHGAIVLLAQGKFYSLFSLLFGVGAAIQLQRATERGRPFARFFARRLGLLLLIGLIHAVGIWFGDILVMYALIGFVLLAFRNRSNRTLAVWTVILLCLPVLIIGGFTGLIEIGRMFPESAAEIEQSFVESAAAAAEALTRARETYASGSHGEILTERLSQLGTIYSFSWIFSPNILAMFLIGFNLGRRRTFDRLDEHAATIRRALPLLLIVGLATGAAVLAIMNTLPPMTLAPLTIVQTLATSVSALCLCFFYVGSIALLRRGEAWRRRLQPLAAVGRMALTNYLMHSLVFTTLANSYGFGLYGRISPSVGLGMTVAMYLIQIPLSAWWLSRFRYGPAEWLWRSLTYGAPQPMRLLH